ncbi:MAG TPA: YggT family protein [Acidimicrobiales bacterium]|nr:YggT family protein [Acidimicrobiales bacterium]
MHGAFMASVGLQRALGIVLELYVIILVARALMSWFPLHPGSPLVAVVRTLDRLTEPVLRPIRRILPPVRAGGMAIDLSIIVAIFAVQIIGGVIVRAV